MNLIYLNQRRLHVFAIVMASLLSGSCLAQTALSAGQLSRPIAFDETSPLTTNSALMQRLLTQRQRQRTLAALVAKGETLAKSPLDLDTERFAVYLPTRHPAAGYGLLVFVPPWQEAQLPPGWARVLDRAGVIFVSAEHSGNEEAIDARRIPLALTAAYALTHRYPIDPNRTLIGGFSGGSRVALRIALAYPDIFSGVLLNAGSDPIGAADPLPSPALMSLLQTHSRFVFVTGETDEVNLYKDVEARSSLGRWCIEQTQTLHQLNIGHEVMNATGLSGALDALSEPIPADEARSTRCRSRLSAELQSARATGAALRAQPQDRRVEAGLDRLDRDYGSLLDSDTSGPGAQTP